MKKIILIFIAMFTLVACNKNDEDINENPQTNLTPESGKQALEDNAISLINEIDAFRNDPALAEIEEFTRFLLDEDSTPNTQLQNTVKTTFINIHKLKTGAISPITFAKIQTGNIAEPGNNLESEFTEMVGTYNWNNTTKDFDKITNSNNQIIYNVTNNGKTAVLTVDNFKAINHKSGKDLPTNLNINLKVSNQTIFSHNYSVTIATDKFVPTAINNTVTLGTLSFSQTLANSDNSNATVTNSLKINNKNIIGFDFSGQGNLTSINDNGTEEDPISMLNSASVTFSLLNANVKIKAAQPSDNLPENATEVDILNNVLSSSLNVNNQELAVGEFYNKTYTEYQYVEHENSKFFVYSMDSMDSMEPVAVFDTWEEYESSSYSDNENYFYSYTNFWEEQVEVEEPDLKFVFKDGSKADLATYFSSGFGELMDNINSLVANYQTKFN